MIRLVVLTMAGLLGALLLFGEPGPRQLRSDAHPAPVPEVVEVVPAPTPAAVVAVAAQTPQRRERFAGPPLRPSPEFAGAGAVAASVQGTGAVAASGADKVLYVIGNKVNFRAGPSTGDAVVGSVPGGSAVEAIGPADAGWVPIRDAEGREGYMSASFLSPNRPG